MVSSVVMQLVRSAPRPNAGLFAVLTGALLVSSACAPTSVADSLEPDAEADEDDVAPESDDPLDDGAPADDVTTEDGGAPESDDPLDDGAPSRCTVGERTLVCEAQSTTLWSGITGIAPREVHWQTPLGDPPAEGWPVALLFQGSLFTAETFWVVLDTDLFGYASQGRLTKRLLDEGFAVVTPEAHAAGFTAWDTNIPPMAWLWEQSADHHLMLDIFEAIEDGTFGPLDATRLYAAGISSGGYMTSRMDVAYRDRFRALAIQSASYATCGGALCDVPADLDDGHLPTLFLHGEADVVVPIFTMWPYHDALAALGVDTDVVTDPDTGHAWLEAAPEAITDWFLSH